MTRPQGCRRLAELLVPISVALPVLAGPAYAQEPPERLSLLWAVDGALASHPLVGSARAGMDRAQAGQGEARSAWWPSVSVGGTYTRYQLPFLVRPLHSFDVSLIEFDDQPIQGRVFMDWLAFDGGRRRARIRRSDAQSEGATAVLETGRMTVIERTTAAYLDVLTLREVHTAQEAQVRALEAERERVRLLLDAGRAPEVDLLRAEAALSRAQADLASFAARVRAAEDQLARLAGIEGSQVCDRPLDGVGVRGGGAGPSDRIPPEASPAPDSLHPALRESWSRIVEAQAQQAEAKASWFPELDLSAGAVQYGAPSRDFTNEWQVGVTLSYPLFTGFGRSSRIAAAEAGVGMAREAYRLEELELSQQLDQARAAREEAVARVEALERAVAQFREVARIEALALEAGSGVQQDFLDAEANLFQSQAGLAQARNDRVGALVREAAARGRLDRAWIVENLESQR